MRKTEGDNICYAMLTSSGVTCVGIAQGERHLPVTAQQVCSNPCTQQKPCAAPGIGSMVKRSSHCISCALPNCFWGGHFWPLGALGGQEGSSVTKQSTCLCLPGDWVAELPYTTRACHPGWSTTTPAPTCYSIVHLPGFSTGCVCRKSI